MSQFFVRLFDRDFFPVLGLPEMSISPLRWGSLAQGGPESAIIQIDGSRAALLLVEGWLRFGVEIYNSLGQPVWWGYVESYQLDTPTSSSSNSVEDLSNSIRVEYGEAATGFAEDAGSIAEYGRKQLVLPVSPSLAAGVAQRQATELESRATPQPIPGERGGDESRATLYCVGWLKSLGWLFYSRADGLLEYVGTGSTEQVFGLGVTGAEFWFAAQDRIINDTGLNLGDFERGQKITVSGSASNNTTYTIANPTDTGPAGVTVNQLNWSPPNTVYRAGSTTAAELAWLAKGDRVHITGADANSGWYRVTAVSGSWADMWFTVAETIPSSISTYNTTIWRGHSIALEEQPTEEKPGASVTLIVDGSYIAQRIRPTTSWSIYTVSVKLRKIGSPADGVILHIDSDSAGLPNTNLASVTVSASSISSNGVWTDFVLSSPLSVTGGTYYWLTIYRSGSLDADDYYSIAVDEDAGYGDGYLRLFNGSAWVQRTVEASMLFRAEGEEETTAQIDELVDSAGQFLDGAIIDDSSGVSTLQYRDGIADAKTELSDLLAIGTSNGRRLLCAVEQGRALRVREEPAYSGRPDYIERLDGQFVEWQGTPLPPGQLIAGTWLRTESPLAPPQGAVVDPTLRFVERCEYDAVSGRYRNTPRGAPNIWRLAVAPGS